MPDAIASYVVVAMAILLVVLALTVSRLLARTRTLVSDRDNAQGFNAHLQQSLSETRAARDSGRVTIDELRTERDSGLTTIDELRLELERTRAELERNHYLRDVAEDELRVSTR